MHIQSAATRNALNVTCCFIVRHIIIIAINYWTQLIMFLCGRIT